MNVHVSATNELVGVGIYEPGEAGRLTGIAPQKLRRWLRGHRNAGRDYAPLWAPQIDVDDERLYLGFRDLTEAPVVAALIASGVPAQKVRRAIEIPQNGRALPTLFAPADERARTRFLEFFAVHIRNPNTRRSYMRGATDFSAWCEARGVATLAAVQPMHVAAFIEELGQSHSVPTVKQRLAAIRALFDWLVVGQVVPVNPASSVRGPGSPRT